MSFSKIPETLSQCHQSEEASSRAEQELHRSQVGEDIRPNSSSTFTGVTTRQSVRMERRSVWESTGYAPPMTGGTNRFSKRDSKTPLEITMESEERRKAEAVEVGLSEEAAWAEIKARQDYNLRKAITWGLEPKIEPELKDKVLRTDDKDYQKGIDNYPQWPVVLRLALNLDGSSSDDISVEELVDRIKTARTLLAEFDKGNRNQ